MKESIYLVLNKSGVVRSRKSRPDLRIGEITIKLNLVISDDWFKKFIPEGTVSIPNTAVAGDGLEIEFTKMSDTQLAEIDKKITIEIEARDEDRP